MAAPALPSASVVNQCPCPLSNGRYYLLLQRHAMGVLKADVVGSSGKSSEMTFGISLSGRAQDPQVCLCGHCRPVPVTVWFRPSSSFATSSYPMAVCTQSLGLDCIRPDLVK